MNIFIVIMMIPYGGQVGTIACVGKAMGENNPKKARTLIKIAVVVMLVIDFMLCLMMIFYGDPISKIFTSS